MTNTKQRYVQAVVELRRAVHALAAADSRLAKVERDYFREQDLATAEQQSQNGASFPEAPG